MLPTLSPGWNPRLFVAGDRDAGTIGRVATSTPDCGATARFGNAWSMSDERAPDAASLVTWAMRATVIAGVITPPAVSAGVETWNDVARIATSAAAWVLWAIALLCVLVPASVSLTAVRLSMPALALVSIGAFLADPSPFGTVTVALSTAATILVLSADVGESFVQLSAYGDERRHLLRCPPAMIVTLVLAWVVWAASGALAVVAANADAGVPAVVAALVFVGCGAVLPVRFHRFSRRWLVRVPAGLVVHDHVVLAETAMFPARTVTAVSPSSDRDSDRAADLTGGCRGAGLRIDLVDFETVVLAATRTDPGGRAIHARSVTVCPSRPGRALGELTTPPPNTTSPSTS